LKLTIALSRREVHEIEKRKRERRKKLQARQKKAEEERQERMMHLASQNPMLAYGMASGMTPMMPHGVGGGGQQQMSMPQPQQPPPQADQSGNPYAPRGGR